MAIEGAPVVTPVAAEPVAQPGSQPTPPPASVTPGTPDPASKAWETEKAGYLRDLQTERRKRQEYEQQVTASRAELEQERKRVQALAGLNVPSPQDVDDEQIRARLGKMGVPMFSDEDMAAWREFRQTAAQMQETNSTIWRDKARQMTSAVESAVAKELGGEELTPRQQMAIRAAYVRAAEDSPEFLARHERGDLKLVQEFAKEWVEDWFEPIRRKQTQQQVDRFRPVPGAKDRSIPGVPGTKIDVTDPKAVENLLVSGFKERGGQFGRRSG
jgi:hypothetical protein